MSNLNFQVNDCGSTKLTHRLIEGHKNIPVLRVSDWLSLFERDYFDRGGSVTTWKGGYCKVFKHLPSDAVLTADLLHDLVISTKPNSRTRVRVPIQGVTRQPGFQATT